ncbi:MAG: hypothetical protein GQF41_3966 [Candidatus Rifleibacterium amylolyticum]|nr:MAG: hypothetical protein GQF41_3966 [Candidatus Rifleibacterium amylolyticum]
MKQRPFQGAVSFSRLFDSELLIKTTIAITITITRTKTIPYAEMYSVV